MDEMIATLGGRAAEEIVFGKISTGALNDLEKVTKQAYAMVAFYGLNNKIGNISYYDSSGQSEYSFSKPFSEETARVIDEEMHNMVEQAYTKAKEILTENREKLNELAEILLQKEVIFREDLEKIFGKRPFPDHDHIMMNGNGDTPETETATLSQQDMQENVQISEESNTQNPPETTENIS
jgi:cell division protease FtsH